MRSKKSRFPLYCGLAFLAGWALTPGPTPTAIAQNSIPSSAPAAIAAAETSPSSPAAPAAIATAETPDESTPLPDKDSILLRDEMLPSLDEIFAGGSNSLMAIAVGSAEGTRTPDGGYTPAYKGHKDPGNGVWNLGSFSYQHGAASPEEADEKQLARLKKQTARLLDQAYQSDLPLTVPEIFNGADLINQSPLAGLSGGGYVDRLIEARQNGLTGNEAIAWARTYSYLDPATGQWDAPGLGNSAERITADQKRRMEQIQRALEAQNP